MKEKLEKLQEMIGYQFKDPGLLTHALTHSSYANEKHWDKTRCNERLEFLGDAVLEVISSDFLFHTYESMPEGEMTKLRASLVCEPTLAYCADVIPLGDYLLLGKGEDVTALYGIGSTTALLNQLDRGIVKGLMAWNRFDEGYLSVEKAVQAAGGEWKEKRITLTPEYIDGEILRSGIFEKMLYPME